MKKFNFLFCFAFFAGLGFSLISFSIIFRLADQFSFNTAQVGLFIAMGQAAYFTGLIFYHRLISSFNPVKVFSVSSVLVFLGSIPIGFTRIQAILFVSYIIIQINTGLFWPPVMAWLTSALDRQGLNRAIGLYNRSWMAAHIIGPLIAGVLYPWNSNVNFFAVSLSYFLVIPIIFFMKLYIKKTEGKLYAGEIPVTETPGPDVPQNNQNEKEKIRLTLYRYRGWISGLSTMIFLGVLANTVPLHIRDSLGYTELSAGVLLFLRCIASFFGFTVLAKFTGWNFNRNWFVILQCGLLFCTLLMIFTGNSLVFYYIIVLLYGFLFAACYNNSIFYSGATGGNNKKHLAAHELFLTSGIAAGTAGGGYFYQLFSFIGAGLALFIALGLVLIVLLIINHRDSRLEA